MLNTYSLVWIFLKFAFEFFFIFGKEPRDPTGAGKVPGDPNGAGKVPGDAVLGLCSIVIIWLIQKYNWILIA